MITDPSEDGSGYDEGCLVPVGSSDPSGEGEANPTTTNTSTATVATPTETAILSSGGGHFSQHPLLLSLSSLLVAMI